MAKFEGQERRMPRINACLQEYGMNTLEDARDLTMAHGINVEEIVKGVQPIAFDNAVWAYTLGTALALKKGVKSAAEASGMQEGMRALLWRELRNIHSDAVQRGGMEVEERRHLENVYSAYHNIGGNGTGTRLYEESMHLPVLD